MTHDRFEFIPAVPMKVKSAVGPQPSILEVDEMLVSTSVKQENNVGGKP